MPASCRQVGLVLLQVQRFGGQGETYITISLYALEKVRRTVPIPKLAAIDVCLMKANEPHWKCQQIADLARQAEEGRKERKQRQIA